MVSLEVAIAITTACLAATTTLGVTNFLRIRRLDREVRKCDEEILRVDQEVQKLLRKTTGGLGEESAKPGG